MFDTFGGRHASARIHVKCGESSGPYLCRCDDRDDAHLDYEQAICTLNQFRLLDAHALMLNLLWPGEAEPAATEHLVPAGAIPVDSACGPSGQSRAFEKIQRYESERVMARDAALRTKLSISEREAIEAVLRDEYDRDVKDLRQQLDGLHELRCAKSPAFIRLERLQTEAFEAPR